MATDFGKLVLDEMPDGIVITTLEGTVLYWNKGAETVFGYTETEALQHTFDDLIAPHDPQKNDPILEGFLRAGVSVHEALCRKKNGTLIHVNISNKTLCDEQGQNAYLLISNKDITHLKALRDAKLIGSKFGNLLDSMPDGIVMVNSTGRIVLVNTQAEKLFGYQAAELSGQPVEVLLPQRYRSAHVGHRSNYFMQPRTRMMGVGLDLYGLRKDGIEFPVEISLSPIETEEDVLSMSAIRDISERKRIERSLHEKNLQLENANISKDRFLAGMSHELRTPLNAIIGFTGILLMKLPGPLTFDQDKQLKTIQTSARHLLSLINDLLDLAKIESGKMVCNVESVVCQSVLSDLAETLRPQAEQKGLAFKLVLPADDIVIQTDRRALSQIVINLVNNAIKFTAKGEVLMQLEPRLDGGQPALAIEVIDSGIGIKQEDQDKLFQAFSQIDNTSTRRFEGTGLGLYLSQKLANMIGARLSLRSEYGKGSIFTLTLRRD